MKIYYQGAKQTDKKWKESIFDSFKISSLV